MVLKRIFYWILGYMLTHFGIAVEANQIQVIPGRDYPNYQVVPTTSFRCSEQLYIPGLYADLETKCQVYHYCDEHRQESFLCPEGKIFNQLMLACDYWYSSNCSLSPSFYSVNAPEVKPSTEENYGVTEPIVEEYYSNNLMLKIMALYDHQVQSSDLKSEMESGIDSSKFKDSQSDDESSNEVYINPRGSDSFISMDGFEDEDYNPMRNGDISYSSSFTNGLKSNFLNKDYHPTRNHEDSDSPIYTNHLENKLFTGDYNISDNVESFDSSSLTNELERKYLNLDHNSTRDGEGFDSSNLNDRLPIKYFNGDDPTRIGEDSPIFTYGSDSYLKGVYNPTDTIVEFNTDDHENRIHRSLEEDPFYSEDDDPLLTLHEKIESKELADFYEDSGDIEEYDPNTEHPQSEMLDYDPFIGSIEENSDESDGIEESNVLLKRSQTYGILTPKKTSRRKPIYFDSEPEVKIVTLPTANSRRKRVSTKTTETDFMPTVGAKSEQIEASTQFSDTYYNDEIPANTESNIPIDIGNEAGSFRDDTNLEYISLPNDYEQNGNGNIDSWSNIVSEYYSPELGKSEEFNSKEGYSATNSDGIFEIAESYHASLDDQNALLDVNGESDFERYDSEFHEKDSKSPDPDETIEADEKLEYVLPESTDFSDANFNPELPDFSDVPVSEETVHPEILQRDETPNIYYLNSDSEYQYNFETSETNEDIQNTLSVIDENYSAIEITDASKINSLYETDFDTMYSNFENTDDVEMIPGSPYFNDVDSVEISEREISAYPNSEYDVELKNHENDILEASTEYIRFEDSFRTSEENSMDNLDFKTSNDPNEAFDRAPYYNSNFQDNYNHEIEYNPIPENRESDIEASTEYTKFRDSFRTSEENSMDNLQVGVKNPKDSNEIFDSATYYYSNFKEKVSPEIEYYPIPEKVPNYMPPAESYEHAGISFDRTEVHNIADSFYEYSEEQENTFKTRVTTIQEFGQKTRAELSENESLFKLDTSSQSTMDSPKNNVDEDIPLDGIELSGKLIGELSESSENQQNEELIEIRDQLVGTSDGNELDIDDSYWDHNLQNMKTMKKDFLSEHGVITIDHGQVGGLEPTHIEENPLIVEKSLSTFDVDITSLSSDMFSGILEHQQSKKSETNVYRDEVSNRNSGAVDDTMFDPNPRNTGDMKDVSKDSFPNRDEGSISNGQNDSEPTHFKKHTVIPENEKISLDVDTSTVLPGMLSEILGDQQSKKPETNAYQYEFFDSNYADVDDMFGPSSQNIGNMEDISKDSSPNVDEGSVDNGPVDDFEPTHWKENPAIAKQIPLDVDTTSALFGMLPERLEDQKSKKSFEFSGQPKEASDDEALEFDGFRFNPSSPNMESMNEDIPENKEKNDHGQVNDSSFNQKDNNSVIASTDANERILKDEPLKSTTHKFLKPPDTASVKSIKEMGTVSQKTAEPRHLTSEQNFKSYRGFILNDHDTDDAKNFPFKLKLQQLFQFFGHLGNSLKSSMFSYPGAEKQYKPIGFPSLESFVKKLVPHKRAKLRGLKNLKKRPLEWLKSKGLR